MECSPLRAGGRRPVAGLLIGVGVACGALSLGPAGCAPSGAAGATPGANSVLTLFAPPSPADAARWATDEYDADRRQRGITMLANADWGGESVYVELYRAAARDEDPGVRAAAARALARHGQANDVPLLLPGLQSDSRLLRWEVATALQRLHNPAAIRPLIRQVEVANEPAPEVREAAAVALGQFADLSVVVALLGALNDRDLAVNRAAKRSLQILTGQDFGFDTLAWSRWVSDAEKANKLFAQRQEFTYPVFSRDRRWFEVIVPWLEPPNEIASAPIGMPGRVIEAPQDQR
jgi:hypothetical protein